MAKSNGASWLRTIVLSVMEENYQQNEKQSRGIVSFSNYLSLAQFTVPSCKKRVSLAMLRTIFGPALVTKLSHKLDTKELKKKKEKKKQRGVFYIIKERLARIFELQSIEHCSFIIDSHNQTISAYKIY